MNAPPARIVFLDRETLPGTIALRPFGFPAELTAYDRTRADEVRARIAEADIVITNKVPISREAMASAPRLRLIAVAATGTNMIDLGAARERGIVVSNVRNYAKHTVPEHTLALILALRRSLLQYRNSVAAGRWQEADQFCYFDYPIADLGGSTLGIIGGGALGSAVARLGQAFGMTTIFAGRKGDPQPREGRVPFAQVLERSDVLTLHVPLLPETRDLIGAAELALMKRRALLINTARGGLVNEVALYDALTSGRIAGAGFDVASAEPPPADHVLMKLLALPNFLLTPHVAWASEQAIQALADQLIENIELFMAGTPRNIVD